MVLAYICHSCILLNRTVLELFILKDVILRPNFYHCITDIFTNWLLIHYLEQHFHARM